MNWTGLARTAVTAAAATLLAGAIASGPEAGAQRAAPPLPLTALAPSKPGTRLVLLITSEAGKTDFESALGRELADNGSGVLILDAKAYLSTAKSPAKAANEAEEAIRRYARVWNRARVVVVGYSRGADIAPFIANRLSAGLKQQLDGVVLLGPAGRASFELTLREAVTKRPRATDLPVMPELERLRGTKLICAYGKQEQAAFCSRVDSTLMRVVVRDGGHNLSQVDGKPIARLILDRVGP
jgi:type IV secretory pathway VirJ component